MLFSTQLILNHLKSGGQYRALRGSIWSVTPAQFAVFYYGQFERFFHYSLIGTRKMYKVEPFEWLKNTLEIIPTHPIN